MASKIICAHPSYHVIDVKEEDGKEFVQYECADLDCEKTWWEESQ